MSWIPTLLFLLSITLRGLPTLAGNKNAIDWPGILLTHRQNEQQRTCSTRSRRLIYPGARINWFENKFTLTYSLMTRPCRRISHCQEIIWSQLGLAAKRTCIHFMRQRRGVGAPLIVNHPRWVLWDSGDRESRVDHGSVAASAWCTTRVHPIKACSRSFLAVILSSRNQLEGDDSPRLFSLQCSGARDRNMPSTF
ncbi:hypothetical protein B0H11DRAFT_770062 [Mycena galericulata]|nr:hypothetical protein B0H11DRAFT_770062 [Mycena galericulata]